MKTIRRPGRVRNRYAPGVPPYSLQTGCGVPFANRKGPAAAKRVRRHEAMVQDVLPDLRNRLAATEDAILCREI
jgi:hypothetical protein